MGPNEAEKEMTAADPAAEVQWSWLTFELHDLSTGRLGKSFETNFTGQRQADPAAAQQEANLLAASVLQRETWVMRLRYTKTGLYTKLRQLISVELLKRIEFKILIPIY